MNDNESVGSAGTTASQLWEQFQKQLEINKLKNKEYMEDEDKGQLEELQKSMETIINDNKEIIDRLNGENSDELESVKSELRNMLNDEDTEVTEGELNEFLKQLDTKLPPPPGESAQRESAQRESAQRESAQGEVEEAAPEAETKEVTATVSVDEIKKKLEKEMNYKDVDIQIENNEINVKATPVPPTGGKSKKKQMKPKNKSNKKMKKKQTKKGGKQIKKRSLKRKMKK